MLLTLPYSKVVPPLHFTYQCDWYGGVMVGGPIPPFPCHQTTIHEGVPPAVAASATAAAEGFSSFILNVRIVPFSPADVRRLSMAAWLDLAIATTRNRAFPAGS